jgi:hypothetical protein
VGKRSHVSSRLNSAYLVISTRWQSITSYRRPQELRVLNRGIDHECSSWRQRRTCGAYCTDRFDRRRRGCAGRSAGARRSVPGMARNDDGCAGEHDVVQPDDDRNARLGLAIRRTGLKAQAACRLGPWLPPLVEDAHQPHPVGRLGRGVLSGRTRRADLLDAAQRRRQHPVTR